MRGETIIPASIPEATTDFNPLPSCEGRLIFIRFRLPPYNFNPLPSCEGRPLSRVKFRYTAYFNPLPSCEGRLNAASPKLGVIISIHSPHARGDQLAKCFTICFFPFQSTPLMRGETRESDVCQFAVKFQSTPLMRGETGKLIYKQACNAFQSTPLMRGETMTLSSFIASKIKFQSTPLMRGETHVVGR